ncbi:hypothetical protein BC832DRAFT_553528 [Gaertneriomyces semiglobifer]|nr:hypothetical protein BC832DRAFT_553528 [Gaertneriomyces semiglobifer]
MPPPKNSRSKLSKEASAQLELLTAKLRRRQIVGSFDVAVATGNFLRTVVASSRCLDADELFDLVKEVGSQLEAAQTTEFAVGNMVKRVMQIIKEDSEPTTDEDSSDAVVPSDSKEADKARRAKFFEVVANIRQSIEEMLDELQDTFVNISNQAWEHIHSREIILTVGNSKTVEHFLKAAAEVRDFQVIVAEVAPSYQGHIMARALAEAGIDTTVITDSAVFAIMSRVNKVILGAHAVTANGGVVAVSGSQVVAAAAKQYSTPVVVCSGLHKLSPSYPYDTNIYDLQMNPNDVVSFENGAVVENADIVYPYFDFIGPEDISLFITNGGTHPPSYVQKLIRDSYIVDN